jgi:hypothetical protein
VRQERIRDLSNSTRGRAQNSCRRIAQGHDAMTAVIAGTRDICPRLLCVELLLRRFGADDPEISGTVERNRLKELDDVAVIDRSIGLNLVTEEALRALPLQQRASLRAGPGGVLDPVSCSYSETHCALVGTAMSVTFT